MEAMVIFVSFTTKFTMRPNTLVTIQFTDQCDGFAQMTGTVVIPKLTSYNSQFSHASLFVHSFMIKRPAKRGLECGGNTADGIMFLKC